MFINGYWTEDLNPKGLTSGGGEKTNEFMEKQLEKDWLEMFTPSVNPSFLQNNVFFYMGGSP